MPSITQEAEAHLKSNSQLNPASMPVIVFFCHTMSISVAFLVIYFSTSKLSGDTVKQGSGSLFSLRIGCILWQVSSR